MAIDSTPSKTVAPETRASDQQSQERSLEQNRISISRSENSGLQNALTSSSSTSINSPQVRQWWKFKLRPPDDEEDQ